MKALTLLLVLTILPAVAGCSTHSIRSTTVHTDYEARGRSDARRDIRGGKLALESAGLPDLTFGRLLRERYHIEIRSVAGCLVDHQIIEHQHGYNEIMGAEIKRLYGPKVFERTEEEARKIDRSTYQ